MSTARKGAGAGKARAAVDRAPVRPALAESPPGFSTAKGAGRAPLTCGCA
eukprot:CAMPEP_0182901982 /NCGR_PEP_ID=MMETSP0034_2-20130328/30113_1 /TAXON_ID=156128 /ORGANISM="Nephroselmis pyriformis, Strain CCMP717" /LENGTH=49 /DNA_ID= /DNA_START= /DNA_END= /DNA_ORIENTATION=